MTKTRDDLNEQMPDLNEQDGDYLGEQLNNQVLRDLGKAIDRIKEYLEWAASSDACSLEHLSDPTCEELTRTAHELKVTAKRLMQAIDDELEWCHGEKIAGGSNERQTPAH